jgi:hypothetical protein
MRENQRDLIPAEPHTELCGYGSTCAERHIHLENKGHDAMRTINANALISLSLSLSLSRCLSWLGYVHH